MEAKRWEITRDDEAYPPQLLDLESPPRRLYGIGDPEALKMASLAVVGARRATPYGLTVAEMAGRIAAECGVAVVSGGAMGCDAAALRGAQGAGGVSIVVPGSGPDHVYPAVSKDVFERAPEGGGCVVSLEPWGAHPTKGTFPKRNRIIAALCQQLLVAEAGERSGTFSTAECASDLGRGIYAIPGCIFAPECVGSNKLIGLGATPIASEEDLEARISLDFGVVRLMAGGGKRRELGRFLSALTAYPMRPDDLANHLGMPALEVLLALSDYEASGAVVRLPDGRYAPSERTYRG